MGMKQKLDTLKKKYEGTKMQTTFLKRKIKIRSGFLALMRSLLFYIRLMRPLIMVLILRRQMI